MALRLRGGSTFALTSAFELPSLDSERLRDRMIGGDVVSQVLGVPLIRKEDPALLTGRGRYGDDLAVPHGTLHAHVVRSPHAHARIRNVNAAAALTMPGVAAVITGEDVRKLTDPFLIALKQPVPQWALAVERVRYVGEPVALVVAKSRYLAEDAATLVRVDYEPLEAVIDPITACGASAPLRDEPDFGTPLCLWGHRSCLCRCRPQDIPHGRISAALLHPDRVLRRRRRIPAWRGL
jgi:hypothetical protein